MGLADQIDIYCERTDWSVLSEPLNASTNAAFFAAAVLILLSAKRKGLLEKLQPKLFAGLIALVGGASLSFHLLAIEWAGLLDSLSIAVFVLYFLWCYLHHVFYFSVVRTIGLLSLLPIATVLFVALLHHMPFNGSEQYFGVLGTVAWLSGRAEPSQGKPYLRLATAMFVVSICMRSIDVWVCAFMPWGTHFLWHILNGIVCFLAAEAYLAARAGDASQPEAPLNLRLQNT